MSTSTTRRIINIEFQARVRRADAPVADTEINLLQ